MGNKTWIVVTILLILLAVAGTALYFQSQKNIGNLSTTASPANSPTASNTPKTVPSTKSDEELIKEALVAKHGWNADEIRVTVSKNDGTYATGSVGPATPGPGGGMFFAKKVNGNWQIVFDGNGIVTCDDLANYSDFPNTLIPQCYDSSSGNMVTR